MTSQDLFELSDNLNDMEKRLSDDPADDIQNAFRHIVEALVWVDRAALRREREEEAYPENQFPS